MYIFAYRFRHTVSLLALLSIISCSGSSTSEATTTPNTIPTAADSETTPTTSPVASQNANTGIFKLDTTVRDLGGAVPSDVAIVTESISNEYASGLRFIDSNGVEIEFQSSSAVFLSELVVKNVIAIEGFDADMLATNGFISVVYPDDYVVERVVTLSSPALANVIVYWPDGKFFEELPAKRTEDGLIEVSLPSKYKQIFFALLLDGALE